jgi:hypothetical protein
MASGPASPGLTSRATKERARREGDASGAPGPARAQRAPTSTDESDRWDKEPTGDLANDTYQGRRRAPRRALRVALVGSIAVLLVGAMFGLPYLLRSSPPGPPGDLADPGTQPAVVVPVPTSTGDEGEISSTAGPAASATPTRTAVRTPTPTSGLAPAEAPTTEPTTAPPTTAVFQPLTIEAETGGNSVVSPAERASFDGTSGGQMVGFLGITQGRSGQGRLVVPGITVPTTGAYTVTFQYVASSNRTAHIFVNGNLAGTVAVSARSNCCGTGSLNVTLQQGANTIEFTNPDARCPAIDRIVITRP